MWNIFKVYSKDNRNTPLSLLLTLNIFHTLFKCFYCYLWTCNYRHDYFQIEQILFTTLQKPKYIEMSFSLISNFDVIIRHPLVSFLMRKVFHGTVNEAVSANKIASFRFPRKNSLTRKLCFWRKKLMKSPPEIRLRR